jgi:hypothetical protein
MAKPAPHERSREYNHSASAVAHARQQHEWAVEDYGTDSWEATTYGWKAEAERDRHRDQYGE